MRRRHDRLSRPYRTAQSQCQRHRCPAGPGRIAGRSAGAGPSARRRALPRLDARVPAHVKDLSAAKGLPFTSGSPIFADRIADADDLFVTRIKTADAIVIGKTNTPEFGFGFQTYNPVYGTTATPYDTSRTAGGSSGGAAARALRMVPIADGSDYMGSLRNPPVFDNVVVSHVLIPPSLLRVHTGTDQLLSWNVTLSSTGAATMLACAVTSTDASMGQRWVTALAGLLCGGALAVTIGVVIKPRST